MKKRILSIFITAIVLLPFILSASALSDDEALVRKRAYYAGIESSLSLLSRNLGTLENVQIQKIVVRSPKDLTTETDVKEFTVSQSQKDDSLLEILSPSHVLPIRVYVQLAASENGIQQNYLFEHTLSYSSLFSLVPLTSPEQSESGSTQSVYYIALKALDSEQGHLIAPGAAYYIDDYYFDIDLSDYQGAGHSLSIPLQQSGDSSSALFPLIRKRAYYRNIEQGLSFLERLHAEYGLSNLQVKRIIVSSRPTASAKQMLTRPLRIMRKSVPSLPLLKFQFCTLLRTETIMFSTITLLFLPLFPLLIFLLLRMISPLPLKFLITTLSTLIIMVTASPRVLLIQRL